VNKQVAVVNASPRRKRSVNISHIHDCRGGGLLRYHDDDAGVFDSTVTTSLLWRVSVAAS